MDVDVSDLHVPAVLRERLVEDLGAAADLAGTWFWAPDPDRCHVPAKALGGGRYEARDFEAGSRRSVEVAGGDEACMELEDIRTLGVLPDDLVKMDDINEATILYNLRRRFLRDKSYTNLGTILIAVNPFKWLPGLYEPEVLEYYRGARHTGEDTPPHMYATADAALKGVVEDRENQVREREEGEREERVRARRERERGKRGRERTGTRTRWGEREKKEREKKERERTDCNENK